MKEAVEKIAAVFDRAGVPDKFTGRFYDEPHHYTRQCRTTPSPGSTASWA